MIRSFPFGQFSQLSLQHLSSQRADPIYKQDPVQVIRFMQHHAGHESFAFSLMGISFYVQKADPDLSRPSNVPMDARYAQTSLLVDLLSLFTNDLRVNHRNHMLPILA